jgi:Family of unknown function (DUF6286)
VRRLDRLVALILGVALAAAGVLAGIETMLLVLGQPALVIPRRTWAHQLSTLRWDDPTLGGVAAAVAAVGVVLLLLQVAPRRPVRVLLSSGAPAGTWVSRRSLASRGEWEILRIPQVDAARVRLGRRRLRAKVRLAPGTPVQDGRQLVDQAVKTTLDQWPPQDHVRVTIRARSSAEPAPDRARSRS